MRLNVLEIKNWGPHSHLVCDLNSPLTGIIGANGKGKSFILAAISYAITGQLPLTKEKYIRNYDPEDEKTHGKGYKATVSLDFEAKGKTGNITREIWDAGTYRSLSYDDKKYTKQAEVEAKIDELVGADRAALLNAVFIKQGELTELVKGTPATRQEIFRRLMNLNFLENRLQDISSKLLLLSGETKDYTGEMDLLKEQITDLLEQILALKKTMATEEEYGEWQAKLGHITTLEKLNSTTLIPNGTLRTSTQAKLMALESKRESLGDAEELQKKLEEAKEGYLKVREQYDKLTEVQAWKADIARWEPIAKALKECILLQAQYGTEEELNNKIGLVNDILKRRSLVQKKEELTKEINALMNEIDSNKTKIKEVEEQVRVNDKHGEEFERKLKHLAKVKELFISGEGEYTCPECGTLLTSESVKESYKDIAGIEADIEAAKMCLTAVQTANSALKVESGYEEILKRLPEKETYLSRLQLTHNDVSTELAHLSCIQDDPNVAEGYLTELKEHLRDIMDKKRGLPLDSTIESYEQKAHEAEGNLAACGDLANKSYSDVKTQLNEADTALREAEKNVASLNNVLTDIKQVREDLANINKVIAEAEEEADKLVALIDPPNEVDTYKTDLHTRVQDYTTTKSLIVSKHADIHTKEEKLKELEKKQEKCLAKVEVRKKLETLKSILSRTGIQADYMQSVFLQITSRVCNILELMNANFMVEVDPTQPCSFNFRRTDGNSTLLGQESLSGGQAVRLALALLLASQQIILPEVGLLVLDEPTSHVDADGVENMRHLFQELGTVLGKAGMQLIVVDHNPTLQDGFVKTITL